MRRDRGDDRQPSPAWALRLSAFWFRLLAASARDEDFVVHECIVCKGSTEVSRCICCGCWYHDDGSCLSGGEAELKKTYEDVANAGRLRISAYGTCVCLFVFV
jgi:hypothetical protein